MSAHRYEISLWAINLTAQEWVIELNIGREFCTSNNPYVLFCLIYEVQQRPLLIRTELTLSMNEKRKRIQNPPKKVVKCTGDKDQDEKICWIIIKTMSVTFNSQNSHLLIFFSYWQKISVQVHAQVCVKSFSSLISSPGWRLEIHERRVSDHSLCVNYMSAGFSGFIFFPHMLRSPLQKFLRLHTPHSQPYSNMFATSLKSCITPSTFYPLVLPWYLWLVGIHVYKICITTIAKLAVK